MKRAVACLLGVVLMAGIGCAQRADPEVEKAAREAAEAWVKLLDAGDYAATWEQAAPFFRKAITAERWAEMARSAREPLGAMEQREFAGSRYATSLPGAPDGEYVILQYRTRFANTQQGTETITPMKGTNGAWQVSGYYIR